MISFCLDIFGIGILTDEISGLFINAIPADLEMLDKLKPIKN